ncbi:MAG: hypothetical protein WD470_06190 [Rhodospirillaceae bacterium]
MTEATASIPPNPFPSVPRTGTPGLEADRTNPGRFWSTDEGPTFGEFLDIINPLQHIPVISSIYRAVTGDAIGAGPRALGGLLYGGPMGMIAAGLTGLFEEASGGDIVTHVADLIDDITGGGESGDTPDAGGAVAQAAGPDAGPDAAPEPAFPHQAGTPPQQEIPPEIAARIAARLATVAPQAGGHIAYNPAAALGAVQGQVQGPDRYGAQGGPAVTAAADEPPASARTEASAPVPAVALQFASERTPPEMFPGMFPAHPGRPGSRTVLQSAGQPAERIARPANPAAGRTGQESRADRLLAQWAAQQVVLQEARAASAAVPDGVRANGTKRDETAGPDAKMDAEMDAGRDPARRTPPPGAAAVHPMLAPQNAGPDWSAEAMNAPLSKYRSAQGLGNGPAGAGPAAGGSVPAP